MSSDAKTGLKPREEERSPGSAESRSREHASASSLWKASLCTRESLSWAVGVLVGTFLFAWLWVDPKLQYHSLEPVFFTTKRFLAQHLVYPGGPVDYLAAFLMQFYRLSWLGAMITAGMACALFLSSRSLLLRTGWRRVEPVCLLAVLLFLDSQWYYEQAWMARSIGIVLALVFAAAHSVVPGRSSVRAATSLVMLVGCYFLAAGAVLLFTVSCALTELIVRRKPLTAGLFLAFGALLPWLACRLVYVMTLQDAYGYLVPFIGAFSSAIGLKILFPLVPGLQMLGPLAGWISSRAEKHGQEVAAIAEAKSKHTHEHASTWRETHRAKPNRHKRDKGIAPWLFHPIPWLGMAALVLALRAPSQQKVIAQVDYYTDQKDWSRVLTLGERLHTADSTAVHDINRALAHEGLLLERMFEYPQTRELDFWFNLSGTIRLQRLAKAGELLLETGHINRAERMAGEALELSGYQPETLRLLFLASILKDRQSTAMPFLNKMEDMLWERKTASIYRLELQKDPSLASDPEVEHLRKMMVRQDYIGSIPDNVLMQISLRQNPQNRMALEYLMGIYLLKGQLDKVVQNIERFRALGATSLPRHVQEAVAIFQDLHPDAAIPPSGYTLLPEITRDYTRFHSMLSSTPQRPPVALAAEFGNTYWYFYSCGQSGSVRLNRTLSAGK